MDGAQVAARVKEYVASHGEGLVAVYLFGSFGRGVARDDSDVDLGLLYERTPLPGFPGPASRLEGELEDLLGRRVQTVVLNTASPHLVHRVLRDGELLHESDRARRIRFEVAVRRELPGPAPAPAPLPPRRRSAMTDPDLVEKKLAAIESRVRELRTLADPAKLAADVKEERFVAHTLQIAIQAAWTSARTSSRTSGWGSRVRTGSSSPCWSTTAG
ncbi:MAG: nucleotidyltransferase domain-containing protein [Gemmatimonadota bacterium]